MDDGLSFQTIHYLKVVHLDAMIQTAPVLYLHYSTKEYAYLWEVHLCNSDNVVKRHNLFTVDMKY